MSNIHPIFESIMDTFYNRANKYSHDEPEPHTEGDFGSIVEEDSPVVQPNFR